MTDKVISKNLKVFRDTHKFLKLILPVLTALTFFLSCDSKVPQISTIDPKIGRMGEAITLTGNNFGSAREDSYVTIAGVTLTSSSYYLWQENFIIVRVPELGESGLVYVHVKGRKSNGVLFSNIASVPRPIEGEELGIGPRIVSINPQIGAPGRQITITGNNFGLSREGGGVFFSWDFQTPSYNPNIVREPEFIEVSETEFGYVSWNMREINVRLPDGAASGQVEVRTSHGASRPVFFDVSGKPGNKSLSNKTSYIVNYSVDIRILEATRPNTLYLWVPMPVTSPSQRNVSLVSRSIEPFVENHRGVSLFKLDNLASGTNQSIDFSFRVDVYNVKTELSRQIIRQEASLLSAMYTQSSPLIPSDNPMITSTVNSIVGREQNPYIKARLLYEWIIENIKITETLSYSTNNISSLIEQRRADSYTAALLYTTMVRAAGIPCIPAAGVLVDPGRQTLRHYWAEFWIDDFGWVPVDPGMGAGAVPASFLTEDNPEVYYFGNLDNNRITFSRGEMNLSQIESRSRLVSRSHTYSLQNIWEEASGGLDSYTSLWGDISITGVYAQ
jgi:transglutaminase-like putative cysteine protease